MQYARRNAGRAAVLREEKAPVRAADGTLLYRTGLLAPGTMLDGLTILPEAAAISAGRVNVTLYACDPESYVSLGASEIIVEIEEGDR